MAWTTPRTWVANETVTASLMNTHVRDNLEYLGVTRKFGPGATADWPVFYAYHNTNYTTSAGWNTPTLNTVVLNTAGLTWSSGAVTIGTTGYYMCGVWGTFSSGVLLQGVAVAKNGTREHVATGHTSYQVNVPTKTPPVYLAAADTIAPHFYTQSAGTLYGASTVPYYNGFVLWRVQ